MSGQPNKTVATTADVFDFVASVDDEQKRTDSAALIEMMREATGHEPVMWGPSIIGFDTYHYKSEAGREGDMCAVGFSPRKAALTIYIYEGFNDHGDLLAKLGKHTTSMGCLYIKKLSDVDMDVLRALVERTYKRLKSDKPTVTTVDEYEANVPETAREKFKELRRLVGETLPYADEVISYAIAAYKIDNKRAVVYISGWKDHVAMYPVPHDEKLQKDLKPYIKGKGTLWFGLTEPLPAELIQSAAKALARSRE